jgi:hypothetical protein
MWWRRVLLMATILGTTAVALLAVGVAIHGSVELGDPGTSRRCVPNAPRDPVVLDWTEDIDNAVAAGQNFAPPKLEVMADGRVIADAVRVSTLSPAQLSALEQRLLIDFGRAPLHTLFVSRQDGRAEQGREQITIWPAGRPTAGGVVIYDPAAPTGRPRALLPHGQVQPLDAGLPPSWRDAVDRLTALSRTTLSSGASYDSAEIRLEISEDQNFLSGVSHGQLTLDRSVRPWPDGVPHVPPYRGEGSDYALQQRLVSGAAAQSARQAFTRYLDWPGTARAYDDGLPGRLPAWYGIWRPATPTEVSASVVPVVCTNGPHAHP